MKKRRYLLALIAGILSLFYLTACSSDEEVLFVESTESVFYEESSEEQVAAGGENANGSVEDAHSYSETVVFVEDNRLAVHVCGAVNAPGVYELEEGSRVMDAVLAAGGFTETADEEYVNLATVLTDGDKVRIPTEDEVTQMSSRDENEIDKGVISAEKSDNTPEEGKDKVNINTAGREELCSLPGIGQTRAESIIAYRNAKGGFAQIEDIMQVSGIKESSFQKIKDKITVK